LPAPIHTTAPSAPTGLYIRLGGSVSASVLWDTAASTGFAWIVPDLHGNVAAQCSSAGSVSDVFRYDAYGKLIGTSLPAGSVPSPRAGGGRSNSRPRDGPGHG
jgi:hypothetical protein